jgi:hypothetical protein
LDKVEGVGAGYSRIDDFGVELNRQTIRVVTYRAQAKHIRSGLLPYDWYHAFVLEGARIHQLPLDYIRVLQAEPTIPDPDLARASSERAQLSTQWQIS